ncbi:hypothetical protein OIV83_003470 [Microbotryomycetes sp. JL201]|nr:hypothetical protein OIV83_003470 [Microbotryomycetes sp. JL201]
MARNRVGGGPKQKGRLAAALAKEQQAATKRAQAKISEQRQAEAAKLKEGGPEALRARKRAKRQRQMEREIGKGKERAEEDEIESEDEAAHAIDTREVAQKPVIIKKRKGPTPFALGERILLVGEGNFSFAHSLLLQKPAIVSPHLLYATAYDSLTEAQQKYPDVLEHVRALKEAGATVLFGVDATKLEKIKEIKEHKGKLDRIVFNFPHVGQGITDQDRNVRANQTLILNFLKSAAPFLRKGTSRAPAVAAKGKQAKRKRQDSDGEESGPEEDLDVDQDEQVGGNPALNIVPPPPTTAGTVLITLRTVSPYSLWCLPQLGSKGSMLAPSILPKPLPKTTQPNYAVLRSFAFDPAEWEGYEHRRTIGYREGLSSGPNEDLTLTAKERGERKRAEKEAQERLEKEERLGTELAKKGGKALMRTYEFELVPVKEE